jgi:electron transport complex protein RnfB
MGAVKVIEGMATVDPNRCIGCGLCVTTCEAEAIRMVPREQAPEPPATISEMGIKIATEKGRIDDFLKLLKR